MRDSGHTQPSRGGPPPSSGFRPWLDAWAQAAYAEAGFWRTASPADHFRTASTSTTALTWLIAQLLTDHPEVDTVIELGAGDGRLLANLDDLADQSHPPGSGGRRRLVGIDIRSRPADLPAGVSWVRDLFDVGTGGWTTGSATGVLDALDTPALVVCVEWLDDLPCAVATRVEDRLRWVEVDPSGRERVGAPADRDATEWASRWAPWSQRVEIGLTRDRAWAAACAQLRRAGGLALLVDYGHLSGRRPVGGSLAAYRHGRQVELRPAPDRNVTAAVAVDSLAEAGHLLGARTVLRARQSEVVDRGGEPPRPDDPLADLVRRSHRAAAGSTSVWGDQWWLLQSVPAADHSPAGCGR